MIEIRKYFFANVINDNTRAVDYLTDEKNSKQIIRYLVIFASILIIGSFIAPWLLTSYSIIDLSDKGPIGDAIGGIMNPFIALSGVVLTFLAFYIQYRANQYQREQFNVQLDKEKEQFRQELELQREQFIKNQFENQFYEMLSIHRENVNDLSAKGIEYDLTSFELTRANFNEVSGVKALPYLLSEFELCFKLVSKHFPEIEIKKKINEAYNLFWNGVDEKQRDKHLFFDEALTIKFSFGNCIFLGKSNQLAHFYRQIFQTVKFIVNQSVYSYEEKRNYIRILRSQLSNEEQVLLFYNWFSGFGYQWENETNKFFTDYRMIHNIFPKMLVSEEIDLLEIFSNHSEMLVEQNREKDSLFEFEDWEYIGNIP